MLRMEISKSKTNLITYERGGIHSNYFGDLVSTKAGTGTIGRETQVGN